MDADSNESSKESGTIQAIQNRVSLPAGPSHSSLSPTFAGRAAEQRSHMHRWGERDFSRHHQRHTPPVPVAPTNTHPEYSVDDSAVQPLPIDIPNSDNNGVHRISDAAAGTLCLPVDKRKVSEREEKDGSLKLIPRPSGSSLKSRSLYFDANEENRATMVQEGQLDTRIAVMQGQSQIVTCQGCTGRLHAPIRCSLVFCPTCNTVSPVAHADPSV